MCPARLLFSFAIIASLALAARGEGVDSPVPAPAAAAPTASAAEAYKAVEAPASDWIPLFNGRDLEGWTQQGSARWRVEDGVIVGGQEGDPGRSGLEFMIDEHGKYNSGVYLRNDPKERGRTGYQVNIGRGAAEEYCAGLYTDRWLAKGDEHDTIRRKLAWNQLRILARGGHIEVTLNDAKVVDYTDPAPPDRYTRPGVVALQTYGAEGHSGWVKFRNLRVRPLK